jgi:hypothetical protein
MQDGAAGDQVERVVCEGERAGQIPELKPRAGRFLQGELKSRLTEVDADDGGTPTRERRSKIAGARACVESALAFNRGEKLERGASIAWYGRAWFSVSYPMK